MSGEKMCRALSSNEEGAVLGAREAFSPSCMSIQAPSVGHQVRLLLRALAARVHQMRDFDSRRIFSRILWPTSPTFAPTFTDAGTPFSITFHAVIHFFYRKRIRAFSSAAPAASW
jgi:hypothetical protein